MANYKRAYEFCKFWEGGKSKDKDDAIAAKGIPKELNGYHTNKGLTWGTYKDNARAVYNVAPTPDHFLKLTDADIEALLVRVFWNPIRGNEIESEQVAAAILDWKFNSGDYAILHLQKALNKLGANLVEDKMFGLRTLAAINAADPEKLFKEINSRRKEFYRIVCDPKRGGKVHPKMLQGLLNRVDALEKTFTF